MKYAALYFTAVALALAPPAPFAFAKGPGGGGGASSAHVPATTPAATPSHPTTPAPRGGPPEEGSISPAHETGQPNIECGEDEALNRPGRAEDARGSAFNEDGVAGEHYAGEQPQNSKNTASVSQYDTACAHAKSK